MQHKELVRLIYVVQCEEYVVVGNDMDVVWEKRG